ncbi:MAG: hypothetical protein H6713_06520 [Myxococcales bacterium]|nr:hypothetical protein [Myxococcales bacterium]
MRRLVIGTGGGVALALALAGCFVDNGADSITGTTGGSSSSTGAGTTTSAPASTGTSTTAGTTDAASDGGTTGALSTSSSGGTDVATTAAATTGPGLSCGDGVVSPELGEECDEGAQNGEVCCSDTCAVATANVRAMAAGRRHACIATCGGEIRCWGEGANGGLGTGDTQNWGDNDGETIVSAAPVNFLGGDATRPVELAAGDAFTCARFDDGAVRCWGRNNYGQLGYGVNQTELLMAPGDVSLGGAAERISANNDFVCALLEGGDVRCWGRATDGALGLGDEQHIGNDELPSDVGPVPLGQPAIDVATGWRHTCVALEDGGARCWGLGNDGELGLGVGNVKIGDNEPITTVEPLTFEAAVVRVFAGTRTSCAALASGALHCWGRNQYGELGLGGAATIGDDEPAASTDTLVELGGAPVTVALGDTLSCAIVEGGQRLHCWGGEPSGALGHGLTDGQCFNLNAFTCNNSKCCIADEPEETPAAAPFNIVTAMRDVIVSDEHACALSINQELHCWGNRGSGRLASGPTPGICVNGDGPQCRRHPDCCLGDDELADAAASLTAY